MTPKRMSLNMAPNVVLYGGSAPTVVLALRWRPVRSSCSLERSGLRIRSLRNLRWVKFSACAKVANSQPVHYKEQWDECKR